MEIEDIDFDQKKIKPAVNNHHQTNTYNKIPSKPCPPITRQEIKPEKKAEDKINHQQSKPSLISLRDMVNVSFLNKCCLNNQPHAMGEPTHLATCTHLVKARIEVNIERFL